MKRLSTVEIAGKEYALNFSIAAMDKVVERCGALERFGEYFEGKPANELLREIAYFLSVFIDQGAKYIALVEGREAPTISYDQLLVVLGPTDITTMQTAMTSAMRASQEQTVEVEPGKNVKATPEQ